MLLAGQMLRAVCQKVLLRKEILIKEFHRAQFASVHYQNSISDICMSPNVRRYVYRVS